ncbi:MAG TPA: hypothetical protein VGQ83_09085 [Polyangia bacterium]|jgi:hypothetical protein
MSTPAWKRVNALARHNGKGPVQRVLLTTLDLDLNFLVDDFLPALLQVEVTREDAAFHAHLERKLRDLDGLTIIMDGRRLARLTQERAFAEHWIHRFVTIAAPPLGPRQSMHAKLRLIERRPHRSEQGTLEVTVGSGNLTRDGFANQVQYLWSESLELGARKRGRRPGLKALQEFLRELDVRLGMRPSLEKTWAGVFSRTRDDLPARIVASVPGRDARFGLARLRQEVTAARAAEGVPAKPGLDIQVPYFGDLGERWCREWVRSWLPRHGMVRLHWVERGSVATWKDDLRLKADTVEALRHAGRRTGVLLSFVEGMITGPATGKPESLEQQSCLPHGKLYQLALRNDRSLAYVGSANLSQAAWGGKDCPMSNFELGVLVAVDGRLLSERAPVIPRPYVPPLPTDDDDPYLLGAYLERRRRHLGCVVNVSPPDADVDIRFDAGRIRSLHGNGKRQARVPAVARELVQVRARWGRGSSDATERTVWLPLPQAPGAPPEIAAVTQDQRLDLLLETYGAPLRQRGDGAPPSKKKPRRRTADHAPHNGDYHVPVLDEARRWFETVDRWRQAGALMDPSSPSHVAWSHDGEMLRDHLGERGFAAAVAAKELREWLTWI